MVKKILNPETGRMVNLTGKIGQKVFSQHGGRISKRRSKRIKSLRGGGTEIPDEKKDPEGYKKWLRKTDKLANKSRQARLLAAATKFKREAIADEMAKRRALRNKGKGKGKGFKK